jgi:NAD(P)-dependent dehydrogenase (short-subunit alcohol dehydrogenase family)
MQPTRVPIKDRFRNKVALVTGGSCGIGQAIALELAREGAQLAITSLPADVAEGERAFREVSSKPLILTGDMAEEKFCERAVTDTVARFERLDYLVNNAFSFVAKYTDAAREDWHRSMEVGPIAFAKMATVAVEPMKNAGGGAIVNISSISAFAAQPKRWTYNAAKGAVHQLTRCMALDLAPFHIRVNSVSPGWVWTRETDKAAGFDRAKFEPIWGDFCIMRRMGQPVEIAAAVLFLLSDDASFITGTDLAVDGGYQALGPEGLGKNTLVAGSR